MPAVLAGLEQQFSSGAGPTRLLGLIRHQDPGGTLLDHMSADLSGAAPADTAETPGELLAAYIVFAVVGIVVAVTAYLVWRTRPKR